MDFKSFWNWYKQAQLDAKKPITRENTNKYLYAVLWLIQLRFVWDISTLAEKYLPMERVYRFIGYWIVWILWGIMVLVIVYNIVGQETFDMMIDEGWFG
mgnify:FL=1